LKQLQLIQILSIKARTPAAAADGAAKVPAVNRNWHTPNASEAASGNADTASNHQIRGICSFSRFTAR
jgi:hypothetical protein